VVVGIGGLGHMGLAYLRELTGAMLIATDRSEAARTMATGLGADLVVDSNEETAEAVMEAWAFARSSTSSGSTRRCNWPHP